MIVHMQITTPDSMLGVVRRLASSLAFDHSADDPTLSRSSSSGEHERESSTHGAESSSGGRVPGQSAVKIKRVRFVQDVTGELPTEIPPARWLFEEDDVPDRPASPKQTG